MKERELQYTELVEKCPRWRSTYAKTHEEICGIRFKVHEVDRVTKKAEGGGKLEGQLHVIMYETSN